MALHGVVLIFLFAPLHETIHESAFASRRLNAVVAWVCGMALLLPPSYFRAFHFAHHRWTQDPRRDPELAQPKPATLAAYLIQVSGLPYWRERLATTLAHACGRYRAAGFLTPAARRAMIAEARWLWAGYAALAGLAAATASWAPVLYWLGPAILGQPALRLYLMAEHTGCALDPNMLINSRTTLTNRVMRRLSWNMPFHIEHHVYPSVPFHALPALHDALRDRLGVVSPGYLAFHAGLIGDLAAGRGPTPATRR